MLNSTSTSDGATASTIRSPVRVNSVVRGGGGARRDRFAGPQAQRVVAPAVPRREPGAVDAQRGEPGRPRFLEREVTDGRALALSPPGEDRERVGDIRHRTAVELGDHRAARDPGGAERVAWVRDVDAGDR